MTVKYEMQELISYHRKQAKLSRIELATLAGVGKTVIYDIEKGKETIKWSTLIAILSALNIEIQFKSPLIKNHEEGNDQNA